MINLSGPFCLIKVSPLSIVIPVLLYHGKGKWKYATLDALFEGVDEEWRAYIPNFAYIYNNLGLIDDAQIERLNHGFLRASILTLKHTFEKLWLNYHAPKLLALTAENEQHLKQSYLTYLLQRTSFEQERLIKITASLPDNYKNQIMNTFQKAIAKGKAEGRAEGVAEGVEKGSKDSSRKIALAMLAKGFSVEQICDLTGLSVEEVLLLK